MRNYMKCKYYYIVQLTLPYITLNYITSLLCNLHYLTLRYTILLDPDQYLFIVYLTTFSIGQTTQPSVLGRRGNAQ